MDEDFYTTLGVSKSASTAEIQKAYRSLARKFHPDTNPDDASLKEKFQKIQRAYEVLNDPKKREMYDRYGSAFEGMGPGGPGGATYTWTGRPGEFEDIDLGEFFREKFGAAGGPTGGFADFFQMFRGGAGPQTAGPMPKRGGPRRGEDILHEMTIPFATAVAGGEIEITVRRKGGSTEAIRVKVPAGIADGKKIRLRGQGESAPKKGTPGDLIVTIRVAPHPYFTRRGNHLDVKVPVTVAEAALGAKIDVPTPKGTVTLSVPPGTSSGAKLRVKGYGIAEANAPPGDLYAEIQIVLPKALDAKCRDLIRQFDAANPLDPRRDLRW